MTFWERAIGVAKLNANVFENIEGDRHATGQALAMVVISSAAAGIGVNSTTYEAPVMTRVILALILWVFWAALTYAIGVHLLPEPQTKADVGELLRTIGFAASPSVLRLFGFVPVVGRFIYGTACQAQTAEELGSYRLVAPIGEGGMGEVWQATHQMLARKAAIKLVRPEGLTPREAETVSRRFQREANLIAGLQSPNTVYLYDFGTASDGRFYYVMELLDGISLQTLVSRFGPQPAARVAHILRQVCESLEEAHRYAVIHRDLKPSNIMLCKVALSHDVVKVLDFGLAKCIECADEVTQLTVEGVASGTPGYIAPEVALGEQHVDHRADIYAVGCVGYFLLTGTMVFQDTNPVSLALKHVQTQPDPPSSRTELPIPAALEQIILKCLEKRPADRPATARDIGMSLAGLDLPPWTDADADAWWERNLPPTSTMRSYAPAMQTPHVVQRV